MDNLTFVVIPVIEEYAEIKNSINPKKNIGIESETLEIKKIIMDSKYSNK